MALDPNIILRAGDIRTPDAAQILETRAQLQMRNAAISKANREEAAAQARLTRLGQIGKKAASGDITGARTEALEGGDFDVLEHIKGLEAEHRDTLKRRVDTAAPLAYEAAKLPYDQRRAFIAQATPNLVANGWTQDEIAAFDPTDEALSSLVTSAQSITDIFSRQDKADDRALRREEAAANRDFQRGNAYISAGMLPPEGEASPAAAVEQRTQGGWTPRARNGGDNTDEQVDNKIAGVAKILGVDPEADISQLPPEAIARALAFGEGANNRNNPTNIIDPKTGAYRKFPTEAAGIQSAAAQVKRNLGRGQTSVRTMIEGVPTGRPTGTLSPRVIPGGKLDKQAKAPSGYEWTPDGKTLQPIKGGPADPTGAGNKNTTSNRKAEADFRKEFNNLPEVKNFRTVRGQFEQIKSQASAPNAQNDIAMIFSYMKMLDPTSVVREGEFATAQNAAGVPDQVRNLANRALNGERLNPQQRKQMVSSAAKIYTAQRDVYNARADEYRGYATDNGVAADRVARKYVPTKQKSTKATAAPSVSNW